MNVRSWSLEQLKEHQATLSTGVKVVCNYYRFDQVREMLLGHQLDIVPLRMEVSQDTRAELQGLPKGSRVMFILDQKDKSRLDLILTEYGKMFSDWQFNFVSRFVKDSKLDISKLTKRDGFAKILVSNRLWSDTAEEIRQLPKVVQPIMEFDLSSIEESKIQLGIIG